MKLTRIFWIMIPLVMIANGCDVMNQAQQTATLFKCDFRILSVQNITLAGVNIQNVNSIQDLGILNAAKITAAAAGSTLPLTFQLNFEGKNPNPTPAGMNELDWILFIDDIQMTQGILNTPFTIPANNGTAVIPLQVNLDLKKVLQGKTLDAIINFGFNLAGVGNKPTRFMAKLKPTIRVGGTPITYPGYITVRTDFTGIK